MKIQGETACLNGHPFYHSASSDVVCGDNEATSSGVEQAAQEGTNQVVVADSVYTNDRIYTVNETQPWAEAVAIMDGAFIAVGSAEDIGPYTGSSTKVIDLGGQFAMPGLHEPHIHLESAYRRPMLEGAMLTFTPEQNTIDALQQALVEYANAILDLENEGELTARVAQGWPFVLA